MTMAVLFKQRLAITELRREIHPHGDFRQPFYAVLRNYARMIRRTAGDDVNFSDFLDAFLRQPHFVEADGARP